jgi:DNA mismatch endonuclease (patch repair protein)
MPRGKPVADRSVKLGGGLVVPYPTPTSPGASRSGRSNRRADTKPEVAFRSALHRRGLRFRKDHLIRTADLSVKPDVVFTKARLAVFFDGCFWHCCPEHGSKPKANDRYWTPKLERNVQRDTEVDAVLRQAGWRVLRIWEHEPPSTGAERVERELAQPNAARDARLS